MSDQIRCSFEIQQFRSFLEKCLKTKVLEYSLKPLTKPGDNYGSIMQSVDVKMLVTEDGNKVNSIHSKIKRCETQCNEILLINRTEYCIWFAKHPLRIHF